MVSPFEQFSSQQPQPQQAPSVPVSPFQQVKEDSRISLWKRAGRVAYRGVLFFTKNPVQEGDIGEANDIAAQKSIDQARREIFGDITREGIASLQQADPEKYEQLMGQFDQRTYELHDVYFNREITARQMPGWRHQIEAGEDILTGETPAPETLAETAVEIGVGAVTELAKYAIFRRMAPTASPAVLFEAMNIAGGGQPGRGAVVGTALGAAAKIPGESLIAKAAKPAVAGSIFATMTAIEGGSTEEISVSFALPYLMKAVNMAHGTKRSHVARMKADMKRAGMDTSRLTPEVIDRMWNLAGRIRRLQMDVKDGKISGNEFNAGMRSVGREVDAIRKSAVFRKPVKAAVVEQPTAPSTTTDPTYMKGFAARVTAIRNNADNMVAGAGKRPAQVKAMREDLAKIKAHYEGIGEHIAADPVKYAELAEIQQMLPAYEEAVQQFTKSPSKEGFESIKTIGDQIAALGDQYSHKVLPTEIPKPSVAATYTDAQKAAAPDQNIIVSASTKPAKPGAGKRMAVQFSSDLLTEGAEDPLARQYYDMLHAMREGYEIPGDTWEIPAWIPTLANIDPAADMGIVRNLDTFVQHAIDGGYDTLYFSALDVNKEQIRDLAERFPGKVIVGGYVDKAFFKDVPNVVFYDSMEAMAKAEGLGTKPGQDFRHFTGTQTQPRLCLSGGCLHKCAFCAVDKKLTPRSHRDIINQVKALEKAGLKFRYVYLDDKTFGQSANSRLLGDIQKRIQKFNPDFDGFIIQTTATQFNRMDAQQLWEHGVRLVELGVESYNDAILKKYHKPAREKSIDQAVQKIREGGLTFVPNIIIGMPEETAETYARTMDFLRRNEDIISHVNVYNLAVYAGTELGKEIQIDTLTDVNENSVVKSFHDNPQVHLDFAKQVYEFGMEQLQKDIIGRQEIVGADAMKGGDLGEVSDMEHEIEASASIPADVKAELKLYIGDIRTRKVRQLVDKFPAVIKDQATLKEVGDAIAAELGVESTIEWVWNTAKVSRILGLHRAIERGKLHQITIYSEHPLFKELGQDRIKQTIVHEIGHILRPPYRKAYDSIADIPAHIQFQKVGEGQWNAVDATGSVTKKWMIRAPGLEQAQQEFLRVLQSGARRQVHHAEFKKWLQETLPTILPRKVDKVIPAEKLEGPITVTPEDVGTASGKGEVTESDLVDVFAQAKKDIRNSDELKYSLTGNVSMVPVGRQNGIDRIFDDRGDIETAREAYGAFAKTRDILRQKFGNTIKLWRAQVREDIIDDKNTLYWSTKEFSKNFTKEGGKLGKSNIDKDFISKDIPVDDIVAVLVPEDRDGYYEFVAINRESKHARLPENLSSFNPPAAKEGGKGEIDPKGMSKDDYIKAHGKPLYHGTAYENKFDVFEEGRGKSVKNRGIHFTDSREDARLFTGEGEYENVIEAYADLKNPLIVDAKGKHWLSIDFEGGKTDTDELAGIARSRGNDGIIVQNVNDAGRNINTIIVLDPSQIKTRQQLESEWEKANATSSFNPPAAKEGGKTSAALAETPEDVGTATPPPAGPPAPPAASEPSEPGPEQNPIQKQLSNLYKRNAHEWARKAGLDEESRRQINKELTGKTSMTEMDMEEQRTVAEHFRKLAAGEAPAYGRPDILDALGFRSTKYAAQKMGVEPIIRPLAEGQSKYKAELREWTKAKDEVINKYLADPGVVTPEQMWTLLNTHRDAPAWLEGNAKEVFDYISDMRRDLLQRMNVEREARGDEPIEDAYAYMQRVLKPQTIKDILAGRMEMPKDTASWMRGVRQNFNPQQLERKLEEEIEGLFSHDLKYVTDSMLRHSLRDIHLGTPRKLLDHILTGRVAGINRANVPDSMQKHIDHASEMPADTREWVQEIVRTVFDGEQTKFDQIVDRDTKAALAPVEKFLNKFGKSMGDKPATKFFNSLGTLVHYAALGPRPRLLLRNKFQIIQCIGISGTEATFKAIVLPNPEELTELLDKSPFLRDYGTEAWIDAGVAKRIGRQYMAAYRWTAVSNAKTAMEASWHATLPLFTDPQYRALGWADPQRTYTEPKNFLYPSEQDAMLREMEEAAGASQYGYTLWEAPQIFRHKTLGPATKLQSWPMNYWTRFLIEQWHRSYHGSPSWNPDLKLPMSHRLRSLQYLIIAGVLSHLLGYGKSYLLGTAPTGLPPTLQFTLALYQYSAQIGVDTPYAKRARSQAAYRMKQAALMHIPGYLTYKDMKAAVDVVEGKESWTNLFFYTKPKGVEKDKPDTKKPKGRPAP